jgi:hypothetical protein
MGGGTTSSVCKIQITHVNHPVLTSRISNHSLIVPPVCQVIHISITHRYHHPFQRSKYIVITTPSFCHRITLPSPRCRWTLEIRTQISTSPFIPTVTFSVCKRIGPRAERSPHTNLVQSASGLGAAETVRKTVLRRIKSFIVLLFWKRICSRKYLFKPVSARRAYMPFVSTCRNQYVYFRPIYGEDNVVGIIRPPPRSLI